MLTLAFFLVLPLIQAISDKGFQNDLEIVSVDAALEPPPPPPEQEPEPEPEPEEAEPPKLTEDFEPLDLSQLELALNPGLGDGLLGGAELAGMLDSINQGLGDGGAIDLGDLDQKPRIIYQPPPRITNKMRRRVPGSVIVKFVVNEKGRVERPIVDSSTDPIFERPALAAVKSWKFEPAQSKGRPVAFKLKRTISFPKELNP